MANSLNTKKPSYTLKLSRHMYAFLKLQAKQNSCKIEDIIIDCMRKFMQDNPATKWFAAFPPSRFGCYQITSGNPRRVHNQWKVSPSNDKQFHHTKYVVLEDLELKQNMARTLNRINKATNHSVTLQVAMEVVLNLYYEQAALALEKEIVDKAFEKTNNQQVHVYVPNHVYSRLTNRAKAQKKSLTKMVANVLIQKAKRNIFKRVNVRKISEKVQMVIQLPADIIAKYNQEADKQGVTVSSLYTGALILI